MIDRLAKTPDFKWMLERVRDAEVRDLFRRKMRFGRIHSRDMRMNAKENRLSHRIVSSVPPPLTAK